jgi:hypothetical protein
MPLLLFDEVPDEEVPDEEEVPEVAVDEVAEGACDVPVDEPVDVATPFSALAWLTPAISIPVRAMPPAAMAALATAARRRRFRSRHDSVMTTTMAALGSGARHRRFKTFLRRRVSWRCARWATHS